jgi:uncharacterized protein DUF2795
MPRLSDKHGPRVDEQLEHETQPLTRGSGVESHSREDLRHEPPADDEVMADPARRPDVPMRDGVNPDQADARAEFARHVAPARFPATRADLLSAAESEHAPARVMTRVRALPVEGAFENLQQAWEASGPA